MASMLKVDIVAEDLRPVAASAAGEFARCGWVVEVVLVDFGEPGERTFFAVGLEHARESEQAVLRYPGLAPADLRRARRLLSPRELTALKLRTGAIRPYGWNMENVP